jgi:RNA-binding protein YlmH
MTKTELLNQFARSSEERILLGRLLDKLDLAQSRSIPAHTSFLSPGERASGAALLAACGHPRHLFFGGYEGAERTVCVFLPDWQEESGFFSGEDGPIAALRAAFPPSAGDLSHRDVLGALMGLGITREKVGDILMGNGACDVLVLRDALPLLLSQWESVGRCKIQLSPIALDGLAVTPPEVRLIRDTVAALRLDAVLASGFSLSRGKASELISAGRVMLNHTECDKPDRAVAQGDAFSCRGLGKCVVKAVLGQSKKGRIMLEIERYV